MLAVVSSLVCVGTGCDSDSMARDSPTSSAASTTIASTIAYALPGGGFTIAALPTGFSPSGDFRRRMTGPIPTETLDRQAFENRTGSKRINVSVIRGFPANQILDPAQYVDSGRRVNDCITRIRVAPTGERQLGWITGPTTVAFVTGFNVADDALFSVAEATAVQR